MSEDTGGEEHSIFSERSSDFVNFLVNRPVLFVAFKAAVEVTDSELLLLAQDANLKIQFQLFSEFVALQIFS